MTVAEGLSHRQELFVAAYLEGEAKGNATAAAALAGYAKPNKQGPRLLVNVGIARRVADHERALQLAVRGKGIADKQNRIDSLTRRARLLEQVITERALAKDMQQIAGGKTGLLVRQVKARKVVYAVDTGLLAELRAHEKQVAQETGDWEERAHLTGVGPLVTFIEVISPHGR